MNVKFISDIFIGRQKNAGKKAIQIAVELQRAMDAVVIQRGEVDDKLSDPNATAQTLFELNNVREALVEKERRYEVRQHAIVEKLGQDDLEELRKQKNSEFVNTRVNAHALATRIRQKMRGRRFELDRIERSLRTAANGM